MKTQLFSIYDNVACVFNKPFTAINKGDAIRAFEQSIKEVLPERLMEYDLFELGTYNDSTGIIIPIKAPTIAYRGAEILSKLSKQNKSPIDEHGNVDFLKKQAE